MDFGGAFDDAAEGAATPVPIRSGVQQYQLIIAPSMNGCTLFVDEALALGQDAAGGREGRLRRGFLCLVARAGRCSRAMTRSSSAAATMASPAPPILPRAERRTART